MIGDILLLAVLPPANLHLIDNLQPGGSCQQGGDDIHITGDHHPE